MSQSNLLVDREGPVATVVINRPAVLNALDEATLREVGETMAALARDGGVRAIIVTGAGEKAFAAGADIAAMAEMGAREAGAFSRVGHAVFDAMEALDVPIIAAVNGFALGGGLELALACDFVIASSNAKLGLPEVSLGVIPGFGGVQRLARRVGVARARELLYTGNLVTAAEAERIGLVNTVTEPAELLPRVEAIADRIVSRAPLAVAAAKRALRLGADGPLPQGLALERELFASLFATADQKEGMRGFLAKRPSRFEGR